MLTVKDRHDARAQRLSQAFYQISVQKSLLEHEAQGLRQSFANERLCRQRGQVIPFAEPDDCHGRGVFHCPEKVAKSRDRLRQPWNQSSRSSLQTVTWVPYGGRTLSRKSRTSAKEEVDTISDYSDRS
jgi:hypothetical protein